MDKINGYTKRCCVRGKDNTINAGEAAQKNDGARQLYKSPNPKHHKRNLTTNDNEPNKEDNKVQIHLTKHNTLVVEDSTGAEKIVEGATGTASDGSDTEMSGVKFFSATQPAT